MLQSLDSAWALHCGSPSQRLVLQSLDRCSNLLMALVKRVRERNERWRWIRARPCENEKIRCESVCAYCMACDVQSMRAVVLMLTMV